MTIFGYFWLGTKDDDPAPTIKRVTAAMHDLEGQCGPMIVDNGALSDHGHLKRPGALSLTDQLRSEDVIVIEHFRHLGRDLKDILSFLDALTGRWELSFYNVSADYLFSHAELRGLVHAWRYAEEIVQRDVRALERRLRPDRGMRGAGQYLGRCVVRGHDPLHLTKEAWNRQGVAWVSHEGEVAVMREIWSRYQQGESHLDIGLDLLARKVTRKNGGLWCFYERTVRRSHRKFGRRIDYVFVRTAIRLIDEAIAAGDPTHPFLAGWDWESYRQDPGCKDGEDG